MKYLLLILITFSAGAQTFTQKSLAQKERYKKARNQFILEYTVFGVNQCIKDNASKLTVKHEHSNSKITIGSKAYFNMISICFSNIKTLCPGKKCIVYKSMRKRIQNIIHTDKLLAKYDKKELSNGMIGINEMNEEVIQEQQVSKMKKFKEKRKIAAVSIHEDEFVINKSLKDSIALLKGSSIDEALVSRKEDKSIQMISSLNIFSLEDR